MSPGCSGRRPGLRSRLPDDVESRLAAGITDARNGRRPRRDRTVTRASGSPSRGACTSVAGLLPPDEHPAPTIVIQAWPVPPTPADHLERGLHLVSSTVRRDPENPLAALKTTSRADYVFARVEARTAGADDALFLTTDGYLSEATSANLFIVRGEELATPSLGCAILPGTTRSWILRWAEGVGLSAEEALLTTRHLHEADEAFISSSVAGILPITRFDGEPIADGRPGTWTLRARADREAFISEGRASVEQPEGPR